MSNPLVVVVAVRCYEGGDGHTRSNCKTIVSRIMRRKKKGEVHQHFEPCFMKGGGSGDPGDEVVE